MEILRAAEEGAAGSYRNLNAGWNPSGQHGLASGFWEGVAWNGSRSPLVSLGYIEIQDERGPF